LTWGSTSITRIYKSDVWEWQLPRMTCKPDLIKKDCREVVPPKQWVKRPLSYPQSLLVSQDLQRCPNVAWQACRILGSEVGPMHPRELATSSATPHLKWSLGLTTEWKRQKVCQTFIQHLKNFLTDLLTELKSPWTHATTFFLVPLSNPIILTLRPCYSHVNSMSSPHWLLSTPL
jgi:hypothetical protein